MGKYIAWEQQATNTIDLGFKYIGSYELKHFNTLSSNYAASSDDAYWIIRKWIKLRSKQWWCLLNY